MFAILWFLFVALLISLSVVWVLDHNGDVLVTWLGYQIQTDVLTAILVISVFTILAFFASYLIVKLLSLRFPNFVKIFFKKSYVSKLEKLVSRHHEAFDVMSNLLLSLEVSETKSAENLQKKFSKLVKNPNLNNFFLGKIYFQNEEFSKADEMFGKFQNNKYAKILSLKSRFKLAMKKNDETSAMAYAKQILSVQRADFDSVKNLFALYKKHGLWQDARALVKDYGFDKLKDEIQKADIAQVNSALAFEAYKNKKFFDAIKYSKIALKAQSNFLPAIEIQLKSWLKAGFTFKTKFMIKNLWRENPHLIFAEIFDVIHRKSPAKARIKAVKKLVSLNEETELGNLAVGIVAFRVGKYELSKELLNLSLQKAKTYRAYKILSFCEKFLGNAESAKKYLKISAMLSRDDHYICNVCDHITPRWNSKCGSCSSINSLEWSN